MLETHSMDSLGHQHRTKKLSPKIALHFKVLCESKAKRFQYIRAAAPIAGNMVHQNDDHTSKYFTYFKVLSIPPTKYKFLGNF